MNLAKRMNQAQKDFINTENFDALMLQEYVIEANWDMALNMTAFETEALKSLFVNRHCGTAILLKNDEMATREKFSFLSPDKEFLIGKKKSITAVLSSPTPKAPKGFLLVTVHGHNGWPKRNSEPLKRQLDELTILLAKTKNIPTVIAGDFNCFGAEREAVIFNFMRSNGVWADWRSATYDKKTTLDHIFARGTMITDFKVTRGLSDHPAMSFEVSFL